MMTETPALLESLKWLGTSLGLGLLVGLERERKGDSRGLRTFGLVGLLGGITGQLALRTGRWELLATGLALIGLIAISAYWRAAGTGQPSHARPDALPKATPEVSSEAMTMASPEATSEATQEATPEVPTTSVVAMTVTGALGLLAGLGELVLAVAIGVVVVSLLYFKAELRGVAGRIGRDDVVAILQFGALSFIVLPLLPDRAWGPQGSLNPHDIWLTVVLVAGVGLVGYLSLRFAGQRYGPALAALAGGLVSSTASTLVFARQGGPGGQASRLILLANLAMGVRLLVLTLVLAPALLSSLGLAVAAALGVLLASAVLVGRASPPGPEGLGSEGGLGQVVNPVKLSVALAFGLAYGGITLIAALATDRLGPQALYAVALFSGLTDIDALTLSTFRLQSHGSIEAPDAAIAVCLAIAANFGMKALIVISAGGRAAALHCLPAFAAACAAMGVVLAVLL